MICWWNSPDYYSTKRSRTWINLTSSVILIVSSAYPDVRIQPPITQSPAVPALASWLQCYSLSKVVERLTALRTFFFRDLCYTCININSRIIVRPYIEIKIQNQILFQKIDDPWLLLLFTIWKILETIASLNLLSLLSSTACENLKGMMHVLG